MKSILILATFIVIASAAPGSRDGDGMSLRAGKLRDVSSSSAPAYWSAECGDRTYVGSYTLMMDWAECRDYCQYFPHAGELGHSFGFADILDSDTMECLRFNMLEQYTPGNGYAGHYWAGGYRGEDGQYRWDSGAPFTFNDFIGNPGAEPYVHLTPGNNYAWNTKSDQNDRNNGCLCKSQETVQEKEVKESSCPDRWDEMDNRCILLLKPEEYPNFIESAGVNAMEWCQAHGWDGLVEWSSYGEFIQLLILKHDHNMKYPDDGHGNLNTYVGIFDNNLNENCDNQDNLPDWQFYSGGVFTEASEMDYQKYWVSNRHGELCYEDQAYFHGPGGPGNPLSRALSATDDLNIANNIGGPEGIPLCQKLK